MSSYQFSADARVDLLEITAYLTGFSPEIARNWISGFKKACSNLAKHPGIGHRRPDLTNDPEALFFCFRRQYLIVYRKDTSPLQVARGLHGARDVAAEL